MKARTLASLVGIALLAGCSNAPDEPMPDATSMADAAADMGPPTAPDAAVADLTTTADVATEDMPAVEEDLPVAATLDESEPNGGATLDEIDDLPVGATIRGNIDASDADVFFVAGQPGTLYRATLSLAPGSQLQPHVTVFDAGRDGDPPADDYVKIVRGNSIAFLGMGEGGYYVAVRDARNVDGGTVGGADFGYTLTVDPSDAAGEAEALAFGSVVSGTLSGAGEVDLWSFDATEGMNVRFDFSTAGDLDGRLYVFSTTEGSWIARQDNRTVSDPNPLLDAPLFASGTMYLVVENIAEQATMRGYQVDATSP